MVKLSKSFFINNIKSTFDNKNYTLLISNDEYKGQFQRFYYICDLGVIHETCWNNVSRGTFCRCKTKLRFYKELKTYIKSKGGRILNTWFEFKDVDTPVRCKCNSNHIFHLSLSDARTGVWCMKCFKAEKASIMVIKNNIALYDTFHDKIHECDENTFIINENNLKLLGVACKKCGVIFHPGRNAAYDRIRSALYNGTGNNYFFCSNECKYSSVYYNKCIIDFSKFEKNVIKFIKTFFKQTIRNHDRSLIINPNTNKSLELDLFFPTINKAIECNGSYWHSTNEVKARDKIKLEQCEQLNIKLLVIDEDSWYNDTLNQQVIIRNFLQ